MKLVAALVLALSAAACASPPAIPHAVSQTGDAWCASCHTSGQNAAPITPHPERMNCVGCHAATGTAEVGALPAWPPASITLP